MKTPEEIAREIVGQCFFEWSGGDPCGPDLGRPCLECGLALKIAAAISAERSAGLSDGGKDRKATGELSDAPKPAPACARCGGSGTIEKMSVGWIPCPECRGKP